MWYVLIIQVSFVESNEENCPVMKGVSYQFWYPPIIYKNLHPLVILVDVMLLLVVCTTMCYTRTITIIIIIFVVAQIKVLHNMIRTIDENVDVLMENENVLYQDAVSRLVKKCVLKHQEIQR